MPDEKWFLRARGRVMGPFDLAQLKSLRARGQLARFHEVSHDRKTWASAETLADLFAEPARAKTTPQAGEINLAEWGPRAKATAQAESSPSKDASTYGLSDDPKTPLMLGGGLDDGQWFYAIDGKPSGPVAFLELQQLALSGRIAPSVFVWKKGMKGWTTVSSVEGLAVPGVPAATPRPLEDRRGDEHSHAGASFSNEPARTSDLAIASFVLGLVWLCGLGSLLAVIFGAISLSQISRSSGRLGGKGLAIAGLVLGILGLASFLLPVVFEEFFRGLRNANSY